MKNRWPTIKLGEVLELNTERVPVDSDATYDMVGVYSFGRGLFHREPVYGTNTSYKYFYRLHSDHVVMSQLFGWEGALALSSEEFAGKFLSPQFPTFRTNSDLLDRIFLGWYMRRPTFWNDLGVRTKGMGDRRRTLSPAALFDCSIPLPPLEEQRRIVTRIEKLAARVEEAQELRSQVGLECDALCRSIIFNKSETYRQVPMRELVRLRESDVIVRGDETYDFAGVYSFGGGVFRGQRKSGIEFAYTRLTRLRSGNFVYPKLMAWEGALGIVPPDCDGLVVSPEFPVFEVDETRVLPETLDVYFRTPSIWPTLSAGSTGTNVRRRRLNPANFLAFEIPVPPMSTQRLLREVKARSDTLKRLQSETAAELDALLPAILDKAFKGEL
jgi:type I restriction enzyme S subunit